MTRTYGPSLQAVRSVTAAILLAAGAGSISCASSGTKGAKPTPQGAPSLIRSDYAEGEVSRLCQAAIDRASRSLDAIAAVPADRRTAESSFLAFEKALADLSDGLAPLTFMNYVSTQPKVSAEGAACEEKVGQFSVAAFSRRDLYDAIRSVPGRDEGEDRLIHETLREFEKNGLKLPEGKLAKVRELKSRLASLEAQFSANLNQDASSLEFTAEELEGVSPDFLARLRKSADGKHVVTTKSTDYTQVMENARREPTRKRMQLAYFNRAAAKNVPLLEEAIVLRERIAKELGFGTWADYRAQDRMAKDGKTILEFLRGLKGKLSKRNRMDLGRLLAFKRTYEPGAKDVKLWDIPYLAYQLKKRDFDLDDDRIREYFPAERVIQGMFDAYSRLLGVRFVEEKGASAWSPDVKLYRIEDAASGKAISFFFTDFYPRAGKYGHAAAFPLVSGRRLEDGSYSKPVSAIVANFNPPSGGKPSLLNHAEVETVFHEFGHIMHQTLTRAPYASLAGSSVARDFVEAPSQMLENWVWSPEVLVTLSGHYSDPSRKLPKEILTRLVAARDFNQGYFYTRQLMLGLLDMTYHTGQGPVDTTSVQNRLYREVMGVEPIPGGHFQAGFGHLMGGYDAGYYGYLWSKVYAEDMFTLFEAQGLLNPEIGLRYRREILERGNMMDNAEMLKAFLGRKPGDAAFFRRLKIQ